MGPPTDLYGSLLWNIGYAICHQLPDRSFFMGGVQMPMCARDTGTYLGFLVVIGLFFLRRRYNNVKLPDRVIVIASIVGVAFYAFDASSSYLGFRTTSNELRLVAGLAFGTGIAFMLLTVASIVIFKASDNHRTFTYRDLFVVYPLLILISAPIFMDLGLFSYYLVSTLVIGGLLISFFIIAMVLVGAVRSWNLVDRPVAIKLVLSSLALESALFIILWVAKYYAWPLVHVPGNQII